MYLKGKIRYFQRFPSGHETYKIGLQRRQKVRLQFACLSFVVRLKIQNSPALQRHNNRLNGKLKKGR